MDYETIIFKKEAGVGTIILDRPDQLNSLNRAMVQELKDIIERIKTDKEVKVLVITGQGKGFCSGGDIGLLEELTSISPAQSRLFFREIHRIYLSLREMDQPVIAAVNGHAVGAGCDFALACDIRIASDRAKMGAIYTSLGYVPDVGATYFFPRLVGIAKACELIFTGDIIDAREAERIGLINKAVPHDQFEKEVKKLALRLAKGSGLAIAMAKNAIYRGLNLDLATELDYEGYLASVSLHTEDLREGLDAFFQKREPNFKGK